MHPQTLLQRYGLSPKKSLGQNFLFDDQLLAGIVAAGEVSQATPVLEVGPGLGALTRHLAWAAPQVVAVELDDRLLPVLADELATFPNVKIVHGDILEQDPADWFETSGYVVVANVPYYITGAILRHLLSGEVQPRRMVLTVQKEVAERLVAEPPQMSLLAVSVQYYGQVSKVQTLKAGAFWPRPDVDSAIIRIDIERKGLVVREEEEGFFRVVKVGFSQKRKQLQKNLRQLGVERAKIKEALAAAGVEGKRRAETLTVAEWVALYKELKG
ncbi:MAG TPA: 16S rRNA (adenine(1518)-N(6)/adenine(1519)-N(6))-dimethyltransferase RsmA [Anaerolineae bacterium]|nr:16S rRNA (adenine(1518)-N(6)/adenine(1519)-N(6))-dimethyltransferase RsmA [Anaerolineae bacterium]